MTDVADPIPAEREADDSRPVERLHSFWRVLGDAPFRFDLFHALRRIDAAHPELPSLGRAARPNDEPVRVGQEPSLAFAPATIAGLGRARSGVPPKIVIHSFGLFGPNGPLPPELKW